MSSGWKQVQAIYWEQMGKPGQPIAEEKVFSVDPSDRDQENTGGVWAADNTDATQKRTALARMAAANSLKSFAATSKYSQNPVAVLLVILAILTAMCPTFLGWYAVPAPQYFLPTACTLWVVLIAGSTCGKTLLFTRIAQSVTTFMNWRRLCSLDPPLEQTCRFQSLGTRVSGSPGSSAAAAEPEHSLKPRKYHFLNEANIPTLAKSLGQPGDSSILIFVGDELKPTLQAFLQNGVSGLHFLCGLWSGQESSKLALTGNIDASYEIAREKSLIGFAFAAQFEMVRDAIMPTSNSQTDQLSSGIWGRPVLCMGTPEPIPDTNKSDVTKALELLTRWTPYIGGGELPGGSFDYDDDDDDDDSEYLGYFPHDPMSPSRVHLLSNTFQGLDISQLLLSTDGEEEVGKEEQVEILIRTGTPFPVAGIMAVVDKLHSLMTNGGRTTVPYTTKFTKRAQKELEKLKEVEAKLSAVLSNAEGISIHPSGEVTALKQQLRRVTENASKIAFGITLFVYACFVLLGLEPDLVIALLEDGSHEDLPKGLDEALDAELEALFPRGAEDMWDGFQVGYLETVAAVWLSTGHILVSLLALLLRATKDSFFKTLTDSYVDDDGATETTTDATTKLQVRGVADYDIKRYVALYLSGSCNYNFGKVGKSYKGAVLRNSASNQLACSNATSSENRTQKGDKLTAHAYSAIALNFKEAVDVAIQAASDEGKVGADLLTPLICTDFGLARPVLDQANAEWLQHERLLMIIMKKVYESVDGSTFTYTFTAASKAQFVALCASVDDGASGGGGGGASGASNGAVASTADDNANSGTELALPSKAPDFATGGGILDAGPNGGIDVNEEKDGGKGGDKEEVGDKGGKSSQSSDGVSSDGSSDDDNDDDDDDSLLSGGDFGGGVERNKKSTVGSTEEEEGGGGGGQQKMGGALGDHGKSPFGALPQRKLGGASNQKSGQKSGNITTKKSGGKAKQAAAVVKHKKRKNSSKQSGGQNKEVAASVQGKGLKNNRKRERD